MMRHYFARHTLHELPYTALLLLLLLLYSDTCCFCCHAATTIHDTPLPLLPLARQYHTDDTATTHEVYAAAAFYIRYYADTLLDYLPLRFRRYAYAAAMMLR